MSNVKRLQRGIKQPVGHLNLRPRMSRHGKPLSEVFRVPARTLTEKRPTMMPNGEITLLEVVVGELPARPMYSEEIEDARHRVLRATEPTGTYGKKNIDTSVRGPKAAKETK